jgi:hypothetical protein
VDALFGVVEHLAELGAGVGVVLGGGLGFDEATVGEHDDVHIDHGAGVFFVGEVEEDVAVDDADGGCGDHLFQGRGFEGAGFDELAEGEGEGDAGPGDGGGAGASVGLEDVAVEDDGALAEGLHVDYAAEGAADEALDLVGAAADLTALALACGAGEGGAGEHAVLGGDPAAAGVAEPAGDALLDGGVAEDAGVAGLHEDGALGHGDVVGGDADLAEGVGGAVVGAEELGGGCCGGDGHGGIIVAGLRRACGARPGWARGAVPKWDWFHIGKLDGTRFAECFVVRLESWFHIGNHFFFGIGWRGKSLRFMCNHLAKEFQFGI